MFTLRLLGGASLDSPDGPVTGRAALRHRLALLALLAIEHPRPLSRDKLLAYLWPESGGAEARHQLRSSLYILRSALGEDAVLSTGDDVRLNPDRLSCDLWEFEAALARDDLEQAAAVYHGSFLSGFHLSEAEEFEHWVDGERARLAGQYRQALEQLAERGMQEGSPQRALRWWSRLAREDPYNSRIALRYMQALEAAGDRAEAIRHASAHTELLRADLDAAPDAEVIALAERLRLESRPAANGAPARARPVPAVSSPVAGAVEESLRWPAAAEPGRGARRRWFGPVVLTLAVVLGLGLLGGRLTRARTPLPVSQRVAAAPFENRTGRPDLDDLGPLAADWIIRGAMETPMLSQSPELEPVYARVDVGAGRPTDPIAIARQVGAEKVIQGSYYLSGDSVLFLASLMDVSSGRMLHSFDPVGAPVARAIDALDALRERIAVGLSPLVNVFSRGTPVGPDLAPLPSLPAYREFVAGVKSDHSFDGEAAAEHWWRAVELDSTFVAPLIQLAYHASMWNDDRCSLTDSIGVLLEPRRDRLTAWDRLSIDLFRAYCRGDIAEGLDLLGARLEAYPRSGIAKSHYAMALEAANRPRAAREILLGMDPERDLGWRSSPKVVWPRYWSRLATTWHMTGEYGPELAITDRWRDSAAGEWRAVRSRALAALGRERELRELLARGDSGLESFASEWLSIAAELAAHRHRRTATAMAESVLTRLELEPDTGRVVGSLVQVHRLLGRSEHELNALERIARTDLDTLDRLEVRARIAVLSGDTVQAERIYSGLAEWSSQPLMGPTLRGSLFLAQARIAAGLGRREEAVELLQSPTTIFSSPAEYHSDLLLAPLRGYPPFEALLKSDN
jgi:DNA-binding SARP family transcriptional activator